MYFSPREDSICSGWKLVESAFFERKNISVEARVSVVPKTMNLFRFDFEAKRRMIKTIKNPQPVSVPTKKKNNNTTIEKAILNGSEITLGNPQAPIRANTAIKLKRMCEMNKEALRGSGRGYLTAAYTTQTNAEIPTAEKNTFQINDSSDFERGLRFCKKSGARTRGSSVLISFHKRLFSPPRKTPKRIRTQTTRKLRYIGFFKTGRKTKVFFSMAVATETKSRKNMATDIPKFHKGSINAQTARAAN